MRQATLYLGAALFLLLPNMLAFSQTDADVEQRGANVPAAMLARDCKQYTAAESHTIAKNAQAFAFMGLCSGYIQGWMQEANGESKTFNDGHFVMTFNDGVTYPQMIHIFVKYIAERRGRAA
jgi:hypothetical protein